MSEREAAVAAVRAAVDPARVTALAAEMVRCDTRNPPGDETAIVGLLVGALHGLGAEVELFEPAPGRVSVLGTVGDGAGSRPTLLVNGHIDVVPVVEADWTVPPFAGVVEGGRLLGRGACDMKGGLAAALEGLRACRDAGVDPGADLVFHLVADEETGGRVGTGALLRAGRITADAAVVPEPSELRVCVAERGSLMADVVVRGRAAHGSDPAVGHSAVADAARIATALHLADLGDPAHPLLGTPTCNVGTVAGGTARNVVAAHATLGVDRRVLPGQTVEEAVGSLRALIDAEARRGGPLDYAIEVRTFAEGSELSGEHPFVGHVRALAGGDGPPAPLRGLYLGTDARFLRNQLGIPAVVYGPGSMTVAHAADEYVEVADLARAAATFGALYTTFAAAAPGWTGREPA